MGTALCKKCRKLFNQISSKHVLCPKCEDELNDKYKQVKDYLWKNRSAPLNQIAEDCDVSVGQLKRWVKEEKLELSKESGMVLHCESCGKEIRIGRFCPKCKKEVSDALTEEVNKQAALLQSLSDKKIGFHSKEGQ